ncbi:MAG: ABC transporter permease [Planctomycetota bacterium]
MNVIALKMLVGDRAKYVGIIVGLTFATLLMTQQAAIFVGLMTRTFGFITDTGLPDIWVMDAKVQFIDDIKPMQDTQLLRVRSVEGVEWAVPLYKGLLKARLENGSFQTCNVVGLDDATLIGGPPAMVQGRLEDLRRSQGVIVDDVSASGKLARPPQGPGRAPEPLKIGDTLELNDNRAVVVGICHVSRTFQSQPVIYTTYNRATSFAPRERKLLSFVLVKAKPGSNLHLLCQKIGLQTGLAAYTQKEFSALTVGYFLGSTGIPINFGIVVALGFVIGTVIAGQTFYNFTLDNLRYFGTMKAMGATDSVLLRMILLQSLTVGTIGYGLGLGVAALVGTLPGEGELAFLMPWQLPVLSALSILLICVASALISIRKVLRLEAAIVFKG